MHRPLLAPRGRLGERANGDRALAFHDRDAEHRDDATHLIGEYTDGYYNTKRRHSFINDESPIELELKRQRAAMAA